MTTVPAPAGSRWTRWTAEMHLLVADPALLADARSVVDAELDAVEGAASRFRADSEVWAIAGAAGAHVPVSPMLSGLIDVALAAARFTDGDVDPTVGSAMIDLGYDRDLGDVESVPRVASVVRRADWTMVEFDGATVRVPDGVVLDLGATAKAAAADRCARLVYERTGAGVLVNLGGDIATAGPAPGDGWHVLVQDTDGDPSSRVVLGGGAGLATSSTQRRRWWRDGDRAHHILDPRSGRSADPVWRTVSVAADSCVAANTISTASVVRGASAPEWVASLGVPARFVDRAGDVRVVGGWPA